jgi:hypothetical protein
MKEDSTGRMRPVRCIKETPWRSIERKRRFPSRMECLLLSKQMITIHNEDPERPGSIIKFRRPRGAYNLVNISATLPDGTTIKHPQYVESEELETPFRATPEQVDHPGQSYALGMGWRWMTTVEPDETDETKTVASRSLVWCSDVPKLTAAPAKPDRPLYHRQQAVNMDASCKMHTDDQSDSCSETSADNLSELGDPTEASSDDLSELGDPTSEEPMQTDDTPDEAAKTSAETQASVLASQPKMGVSSLTDGYEHTMTSGKFTMDATPKKTLSSDLCLVHNCTNCACTDRSPLKCSEGCGTRAHFKTDCPRVITPEENPKPIRLSDENLTLGQFAQLFTLDPVVAVAQLRLSNAIEKAAEGLKQDTIKEWRSCTIAQFEKERETALGIAAAKQLSLAGAKKKVDTLPDLTDHDDDVPDLIECEYQTAISLSCNQVSQHERELVQFWNTD